VVQASALLSLTIATLFVVTAQRAFSLFPLAEARRARPPAPTRGAVRHALTTQNARSTRRERRNQPTPTLIV